MINILFIAQFPIVPEEGGVQRVTFTLAEEFQKRGYSVWFLTLQKKPVNKAGTDNRQLYLLDDKINSIKNKEFVLELIKKKQITVIFNQGGIYKHVTDFVEPLHKKGIRVFTVHHNCVSCLNKRYREIILANKKGNYFWRIIDKPIIWKILKEINRIKYGRLFKRAINNAAGLVLLSRSFISELEHYGVSPDNRIKAIYNPAPFKPDINALEEKENRILYVGRLRIGQKRVDRLLRIWHQLHTEFSEWEFDVVGDGVERKQMEDYVSKHKLNRISFYGFTDPRPFFRKAKFFTLTSDFEGYGMVLVEAQAYGVIPLAFDCASVIHEVIADQISGVIVKNFNESMYVDKIRQLIKNDFQREKMALAGIKHITSFNIEIIVNEWEKLFIGESFK
ncbi:MAG: glycosyltransferase [Candidatus Cyclobacteriaceae bacterium M2_1C_046]